MENFKEYPNDKYGSGIELDEYNGTYSLVASRRADDGNVYKEWVFPSYKKKPREKSCPWKIPIGSSPAEAIETLQYFISLLSGAPASTDDDIPF